MPLKVSFRLFLLQPRESAAPKRKRRAEAVLKLYYGARVGKSIHGHAKIVSPHSPTNFVLHYGKNLPNIIIIMKIKLVLRG